MVYTLLMDLKEIVEEMERKPDAEFLIEWIYEEATELGDAKTAIEAYLAALESL